MRKSLIAGTVLALLGSAASAQTSASLYGYVNAAVGKYAGSADNAIIDPAGSRLGFKGQQAEGDYKGEFLLETRLDPATGKSSVPFWKGGAFVGLSGPVGSIKLGRWWSQAYLKADYAADPFGNETVGLSYGPVGCGTTCVGTFWVDKSVTYEFSRDAFSFGAQIGESSPGGDRPYNVGASFSSGGLYIGLGYENPGNPKDQWTQATVNYDFGPAKLFTGFGTGRDAAGSNVRNIIVGFRAQVGPGTLVGSYNQHEEAGTVVSSKPSLGYQYQLQKQTLIYATVTNDSKAASDKAGYDLGVKYSF